MRNCTDQCVQLVTWKIWWRKTHLPHPTLIWGETRTNQVHALLSKMKNCIDELHEHSCWLERSGAGEKNKKTSSSYLDEGYLHWPNSLSDTDSTVQWITRLWLLPLLFFRSITCEWESVECVKWRCSTYLKGQDAEDTKSWYKMCISLLVFCLFVLLLKCVFHFFLLLLLLFFSFFFSSQFSQVQTSWVFSHSTTSSTFRFVCLFVSVLVESCPGNQMAVISNPGKYCTTTKCAYCCLQSMFDLILNSGGKLDITNRQGLTPLTLAAKLARKDVSVRLLAVYKHVLKLFSEMLHKICWSITDVLKLFS